MYHNSGLMLLDNIYVIWSYSGTFAGCQNIHRNVDTFAQYNLPKKDGIDQEFVLKCIKYLSTCQLQPDHDFSLI